MFSASVTMQLLYNRTASQNLRQYCFPIVMHTHYAITITHYAITITHSGDTTSHWSEQLPWSSLQFTVVLLFLCPQLALARPDQFVLTVIWRIVNLGKPRQAICNHSGGGGLVSRLETETSGHTRETDIRHSWQVPQ